MIKQGEREIFKQIERVKRQRVDGILAKKGKDFVVVTADGSYKVLSASLDFYNGEEGDSVTVLLPRNDKNVPFGAIESISGKEPKRKGERPPAKAPKVKEEKKASQRKSAEGVKTQKEEEKKEEKKVTKAKTTAKKKAPVKKKAATTKAKSASAKTKVPTKKTATKAKPKTVAKSKTAAAEKEVPGDDELR